MGNDSNRYRYDEDGNLIPSVREIRDIANFALTTGAWVPIIVPDNVNCKAIFAKTRGENSWRIANAGDADYMLIDHGIELEIAQGPGTQLFVAIANSTSDVLEVMFLD